MTLSNVEVTEHDNNHIFYDESSVVDLVTITKINPDHAFKKYLGPATEFLPQFISNYNLSLFIPHYIVYDHRTMYLSDETNIGNIFECPMLCSIFRHLLISNFIFKQLVKLLCNCVPFVTLCHIHNKRSCSTNENR